ncbi:MAG: molybdopterin-binding protein [Ilumatobacteraceae bacterium]
MSDDTTPLAAKVLTVSDGVVHGTRDDASGRALVAQLTDAGFEVVEHRVTADGAELVAAVLRRCDGFAGLVVSTGGTGFAATRRPRAPAWSSSARRRDSRRRCD